MTVTVLVFVIVFLAALCVSLFVALVRSARLASEAIKISADCQRIAEDAQSLARSWHKSSALSARNGIPNPLAFITRAKNAISTSTSAAPKGNQWNPTTVLNQTAVDLNQHIATSAGKKLSICGNGHSWNQVEIQAQREKAREAKAQESGDVFKELLDYGRLRVKPLLE